MPTGETLGIVLKTGAKVAAPAMSFIKRLAATIREPLTGHWLHERSRGRRHKLFGIHDIDGLWIGAGNNKWSSENSGLFVPDGKPRPAFNYRGKARVLSMALAADEDINEVSDLASEYDNRILMGMGRVNTQSDSEWRLIEERWGLDPLRFLVDYPSGDRPPRIPITRGFLDGNVLYTKPSVVDEHNFLVDREGRVDGNARVSDGYIEKDFLLVTVLPKEGPNGAPVGRRVFIMARYGACERLHDVLVNRDFIDELWEDQTRPAGDHDLRRPWFQALYEVPVGYIGPAEDYLRPQLVETHWMPEYGPIERKQS